MLLSCCWAATSVQAQVVIDYSSILGPARVTDVAVAPDGIVWICGLRGSRLLTGGTPGGFVAKLAPDGTEVLDVKVFPDGDFSETAAWRIRAHPAGGMVVVGQTDDHEFPTVGPLQAMHRGRGDAFLMKLADDLSVEWSTLLGGFEPDVALDVAIDPQGNIVVAGNTNSPDFPAERKIGAGGIPSFVATDWFLARYSAAGDRLLETVLIGGSDHDLVGGVAVDAQGRILLAGESGSDDFPDSVEPSPPGIQDSDAALVRYDPARGEMDFAVRIGGGRADRATGVWVNSVGEAVIVGFAPSPDFPFPPEAGDSGFLFSAVYDFTSPGPKALHRFGGEPILNNGNPNNFEIPRDLEPTADGGAWITGITAHEEFGATDGGLVACPLPERFRLWTGFVARLASDGAPVRVLRAGGEGRDDLFGVAVGPSGRVHLAGRTESAWFPTGPRGLTLDRTGQDGFVMGFDPAPRRSDRFLSAVVNGAGFGDGPIAPGQVVTLFGSRFGPVCPVGFTLDESARVPFNLADVVVTFNRRPAPLLFVNERQINAIVPVELGDERGALLQVEYAGLKSNVLTSPLATAAPALFTVDEQSTAAALNQDGSVNSAQSPAEAGSVVSLFGTGAGRMDPQLPPGSVTPSTPPFPTPIQEVGVEIAGSPAEVLYAGGAPGLVAGVLQINVGVPAGVRESERVEVRVSVGGVWGPAAFLAVRRPPPERPLP